MSAPHQVREALRAFFRRENVAAARGWVGTAFSLCGQPRGSPRTVPELTQAMIEEALARAEKVACDPLDPRCYAFPDSLEEARQTCTPKGRCLIG